MQADKLDMRSGNFGKDRILRFPDSSKWLVLSERLVRIRLSHLLIRARTPSSPHAFSYIVFYEVMQASFSSPTMLCPGLLDLCKGLE